MIALLLAAATPLACPVRVIDGDTVACGTEHIRLTAIDAPEMPGHCAKGRHCAAGDPFASKAALTAFLTGKTLNITRLGKDKWSRTVGDLYANGVSASCAQMQGGFAIYWHKFDKGGRIAKECELTDSRSAK